MARHLSFRSGNPVLNKNTFKGLYAERSTGPIIRDNYMTIEGTVNKTAISLLLLIIAGYYSYTTSSSSLVWMPFSSPKREAALPVIRPSPVLGLYMNNIPIAGDQSNLRQ